MIKPGYKHSELSLLPVERLVIKSNNCVVNKGDYDINVLIQREQDKRDVKNKFKRISFFRHNDKNNL